jgi:hypothetical protein
MGTMPSKSYEIAIYVTNVGEITWYLHEISDIIIYYIRVCPNIASPTGTRYSNTYLPLNRTLGHVLRRSIAKLSTPEVTHEDKAQQKL